MSETQQGPDWWVASDGKWYPPQSATPAPKGRVRTAWQQAKADVQQAETRATVEQAKLAFDNGAGFFQFQADATKVGWSLLGGAGYSVARRDKRAYTDELSQIEAVGWRLEHVTCAYVMTGQTSRDKFFQSGQDVGVMGTLVCIYLFRRVEPDTGSG